MADREKVIKGLEHCDFGVSSTCYEKECPYYQSHDCTDELKNDILALLKAQEPKWISVKDRLPEEGVLVLVAFDVDFGLGETRQVDTAMCQ